MDKPQANLRRAPDHPDFRRLSKVHRMQADAAPMLGHTASLYYAKGCSTDQLAHADDCDEKPTRSEHGSDCRLPAHSHQLSGDPTRRPGGFGRASRRRPHPSCLPQHAAVIPRYLRKATSLDQSKRRCCPARYAEQAIALATDRQICKRPLGTAAATAC